MKPPVPHVPPRTLPPARASRSRSAPSPPPRFCGARNGLPAGPESGAFQAIVWADPVSGGGGRGRDERWSGGRGGTIPPGGAGRAQGLLGAGRGGAPGGRGVREKPWGSRDPMETVASGAPPPSPTPASCHRRPPAVVTSHGPGRPDTQARGCIAENGSRKPRPRPLCK